MVKVFQFGVATMAFCGFASLAQARDEVVTETRTIDARVVRVKLDGVVDIKVRQGAVASLTLTGEKRWVAKTTTVQSGDTLSIDTENKTFKFGKDKGLHAELVLPNLREIWSEGFGSTDVNGFSGDEIDLTLEGAGSIKVTCNYKTVNVNLGGLGSMNVQGLDSDLLDLNLRGAGVVTLGGKTKNLKAAMGGLGGLDAQWFYAENVNLELSGLGDASVNAKQTANLNLSGLGSVTVYGKPQNKHVTVDGLGKVKWK